MIHPYPDTATMIELREKLLADIENEGKALFRYIRGIKSKARRQNTSPKRWNCAIGCARQRNPEKV